MIICEYIIANYTNPAFLNTSQHRNHYLRSTFHSCTKLKLWHRLYAYFENMTSFSLFHRPRFESKINAITSQNQVCALIASMFTFAARFRDFENGQRDDRRLSLSRDDIPLPDHFHRIALKLIDIAMEEPTGEAAPICILQALILTTFHQLIHTLHRRAWISLGTCVRVAYELRLHLIDAYGYDTDHTRYLENTAQWSLDEERRRAWWTIWEFDVFASTIRSLPTAINWAQNETLLPVSDEFWFSDKPVPSCHLAHDFQDRWKLLEKSGNQSAKSWFIVINSFMRDAQALSNPYGSYGSRLYDNKAPTKRTSPDTSTDCRTE